MKSSQGRSVLMIMQRFRGRLEHCVNRRREDHACSRTGFGVMSSGLSVLNNSGIAFQIGAISGGIRDLGFVESPRFI